MQYFYCIISLLSTWGLEFLLLSFFSYRYGCSEFLICRSWDHTGASNLFISPNIPSNHILPSIRLLVVSLSLGLRPRSKIIGGHIYLFHFFFYDDQKKLLDVCCDLMFITNKFLVRYAPDIQQLFWIED